MIKETDLAKKMGDDIDEMEKMLNDYLEFASSQKSEKNQIFDLNNLLNEIILNYHPKKIKYVFDKDLLINGRKSSIKRCLTNIIDNGISYGDTVTISTKKTNNQVNIVIDDNGHGIPENEHQNVFKPFYRIDKSRSQNKSGVGLGLSIANDIIRSHGGNIFLDQSPNKGLRVKVSLPF